MLEMTHEIRSIRAFSVFTLFFGVFLILGLVAMLLVDLDLIPARIPQSVIQWRSRFLELDTVPKLVLGSLIVGVSGGLLAAIMALFYNIFAALLRGIKIDVE